MDSLHSPISDPSQTPSLPLRPACRRSCWTATVCRSCPRSWAPCGGSATWACPLTASATCPRFWSDWPPWRGCAWRATAWTHWCCRTSACCGLSTWTYGTHRRHVSLAHAHTGTCLCTRKLMHIYCMCTHTRKLTHTHTHTFCKTTNTL